MADSDLVLKPLTLRPGGGSKNPFASFGKGAGFGMNKKVWWQGLEQQGVGDYTSEEESPWVAKVD